MKMNQPWCGCSCRRHDEGKLVSDSEYSPAGAKAHLAEVLDHSSFAKSANLSKLPPATASPAKVIPSVPRGRHSQRRALASQVQAMHDAGRTLESVRLLDMLGSDAEVDSAARIRDISSAIVAKISAVQAAIAKAAEPGSVWAQRSEPDVQVYVQYDKWTGVAEAVGELDFEMPASHLWALYREFDLAPLWLPNCQESSILHSFGKESELYWTRSSPIIKLLSPTEGFQDRNYVDALDEHGCLILYALAPPVDAKVYEDVTLPPPSKGCKKTSVTAFNMVTPLSKTKCRMTIHLELQTPFLFLPTFVISKIVSVLLSNFMTSVRETDASWQSGEWAERMSGKRADYYGAVQQRIDNVLQGASK